MLPILVPLVTAIFAVLVWNDRQFQAMISFIGAIGLLIAAINLFGRVLNNGIITMNVGNWPAPFGITLVADLFSAIMVLIAGFIGFSVSIYALVNIDQERQALGYHPLYHVLLAGICGSFLTGDIFNLYVWFEVMLISSFVLLALGGERPQLEGAIKYVTMNLMASAIFLTAAGILYGAAGTLNMADLAIRLNGSDPLISDGLENALAMMFLVAFGIKGALFPLFGWLPAAYHTPPTAVSSIFAGLLTKVGVYAIIRVFTLIFTRDIGYTHHNVLLIIAGLTMTVGVLGAASQDQFRRILAFHSISQIGYMVMGLALYSPLALAGAILYMVHHSIVKTNLFLISGLVHWMRGARELKKLGGLYQRFPGVSLLFLVAALSLAGMPPLSGFWAKFTLIQAGLNDGRYLIVATALAVGLMTLYSMTKIWAKAFWKPEPPGTDYPVPTDRIGWMLRLAPIILLVVATTAVGIFIEPIMDVMLQAAGQLLDTTAYLTAVDPQTFIRP